MLPVVALVGRTNVGKSTLFNRLTRSRDALVAEEPGLTRDRQYGRADYAGRQFIVVDTGGIETHEDAMDDQIERQVEMALEEATHIAFLVDGRAGLTPGDRIIAQRMRKLKKPTIVLVNKSEGLPNDETIAEFYALGLPDLVAVSSTRGDRIEAFVDQLLPEQETPVEEERVDRIKVAVVGRPNVGKSTMINRFLGEERMIALDLPGTTRESVYIPFDAEDQGYLLIDTAGLRRQAKIKEQLERLSMIKAMQAMDEAHVVVMVIDAASGLVDQDRHLLSHLIRSGRALVIAINKWDQIDRRDRRAAKKEFLYQLEFVQFASVMFTAASHGSGVGETLVAVKKAYQSAMKEWPTSELTRWLERFVQQHAPALVRGRRPKLRYAHQGGRNPPRIILHGSQTDRIPADYKRYLRNAYLSALKLRGTPLAIEFRSGENPFAGKPNPLNERQKKRRKRLLRFVKRK